MLNGILRDRKVVEWFIVLAAMLSIMVALSIAGELDWIVTILVIVMVLILFVIGMSSWDWEKRNVYARWDERKEMRSLLAKRNVYIFTLVLLGIVALAYSLGYTLHGLLSTILVIYMIITLVDFLSYYYYLSKNLA